VTPGRIPLLLCQDCGWTGLSFHHFHAHDCGAYRRASRRFERAVVTACVVGLLLIAASIFVLNHFHPVR
jgi:hypothetical protein